MEMVLTVETIYTKIQIAGTTYIRYLPQFFVSRKGAKEQRRKEKTRNVTLRLCSLAPLRETK
jgi:hypothetical protein